MREIVCFLNCFLTFAACHRVEFLAAVDAAEAGLVIAADASHHALCFEHLISNNNERSLRTLP